MPLLGRAEVYQAPDPEPTPEETQILEFMNRFRADPKGDIPRMVPVPGQKLMGFVQVDWAMFKSEMEALKPTPPLVFNLQLLDAARKHSFYMIQNELGHVESAGKNGYVGASFSDRCRAAGYKGFAQGENCFRDARDAWGSHVGFVVDWGSGGPGGMQPGRGHRTNMHSPGSREVGPGAVPHQGRLSVTHNFGNSREARFVGGVVYLDTSKNQSYDPGEGRGGVKVTASDGSSTLTWKSGAYTLALKSTQAVTVKMEVNGQSTSLDLKPGSENVKMDWIIPQEGELKHADELLARVTAIEPKDPANKAYFKALVSLCLGTSGMGLDAERRTRIDALLKEVGPQLKERQDAVLAALKNPDPKSWPKTLQENRKPYLGTEAEQWFKEAEMVANAKLATQAFRTQLDAGQLPANQKRGFLKQLEDGALQLSSALFRAEMQTLAASVKNALEPPRRGTP